MSYEQGTPIAIIAFLLTLFILLMIQTAALRRFKAEAVSRGAAEWVVRPETGDTEFAWKDKP